MRQCEVSEGKGKRKRDSSLAPRVNEKRNALEVGERMRESRAKTWDKE